MKIPKSSTGGEPYAVLHHLSKSLDSPPLYEPNSVLDPHLTSSPATATGICQSPYLHWDHWPSISSDDWPDPLSFLLPSDMYDPCSIFSDLPIPTPPQPLEPDASFIDLLLRAAHSVESGDLNSALQILTRLNLPCSEGNLPLFRAAAHFKDALLSLLPIPDPPLAEPPLSAMELVRRIAAYKSLSEMSPIPQFTSFTANQTILESLESSPSIHVVDFDLGLGGQWSSFAQDLSARARSIRLSPPSLRITAVVSVETAETALAADNLRDFARGLGLRLSVEFVPLNAIAAVRFFVGDAVAVVLTPAIFYLVGVSAVRLVHRASPKVVIVIDAEGYGGCCAGPFRRRFAEGLERYAAAMEVVEAGAKVTGAGEEVVRRIERVVFRPKIFLAVAVAVAPPGDWREMMLAGGMVAGTMTEFTESQAEWLLRRAPVQGFHVARRDGALLLSWKGRELAATSAWRCR